MVQARHIFENTTLYIRLYLKFYKPNLNTYIVYKLYNTEIKVRIEERVYNYQKRTPRRSLTMCLAPQPPIYYVPTDEINATGTEINVRVS